MARWRMLLSHSRFRGSNAQPTGPAAATGAGPGRSRPARIQAPFRKWRGCHAGCRAAVFAAPALAASSPLDVTTGSARSNWRQQGGMMIQAAPADRWWSRRANRSSSAKQADTFGYRKFETNHWIAASRQGVFRSCTKAGGSIVNRSGAARLPEPAESRAPLLSITSSARASRSARDNWAAMIATTCSAAKPLRCRTRSICTCSGQSTTSSLRTGATTTATCCASWAEDACEPTIPLQLRAR